VEFWNTWASSCLLLRTQLSHQPIHGKPRSARAGQEVIAAGPVSQISMVRHLWEENVQTCRMYFTIEQVLKKQIITVFEPMYLNILNDDMVGSIEMLDHLCLTYESITAVDLEKKI
jgi:hypothetical protein